MPVSLSRLREIVSSIILFMQKPEGRARAKPIHPPERCIAAVHARSVWPGVKHLVGVVEHPILRPDGSITDKPGYDPDTGMIWIGEPIMGIPEHPGQADAFAASERLLNLVSDFEFEDDCAKGVWLACLLTILCRHIIDEEVPLFYFEANTAGSGKSLLCDLISIIVSGRRMVRMGYSHEPVEMEKRLVSILLKGVRVAMMDNVQGEFGNAPLDAVLTAQFYSGRILGKSEMTTDLLINTVFVATANNAVLCGDLYRRILRSALVSSYECPDQDRTEFKIEKIKRYVGEHREEFLAAALTIVRAYILAGRPAEFLKGDQVFRLPINVFGEWTSLIRGAVMWAAGVKFDPWDNRAEIVKSDVQRSGHAFFLEELRSMMLKEGMNSGSPALSMATVPLWAETTENLVKMGASVRVCRR
jgi:hypothetical protein